MVIGRRRSLSPSFQSVLGATLLLCGAGAQKNSCVWPPSDFLKTSFKHLIWTRRAGGYGPEREAGGRRVGGGGERRRSSIKLSLSISCVAREGKCLFKFENSSCKPFILLIELDCVKNLSQYNRANPKHRLQPGERKLAFTGSWKSLGCHCYRSQVFGFVLLLLPYRSTSGRRHNLVFIWKIWY